MSTCTACHSEFHTYDDPCPEIESRLLGMLCDVKMLDAGRLRDVKFVYLEEDVSVDLNGECYYIKIRSQNGGDSAETSKLEIKSIQEHPWFTCEMVVEEDLVDYYFRMPTMPDEEGVERMAYDNELQRMLDGSWTSPIIHREYQEEQMKELFMKITEVKRLVSDIDVLVGRLQLSLSRVESE